MNSAGATLLALAVAVESVQAGFSSTIWSTNRPNTTAPFIQTLFTTLKVPPMPKVQGVFLWPGMSAHDSQPVQTTLTNGPAYVSGACGQPKGSNVWCVQSYEFHRNNVSAPQGMGPAVKVEPGDYLNILYNWDAKAGNTTQQAILQSTGKVISSLPRPGGAGFSLADSIECHANVPSIPEHHCYYNTTIELNEPEPAFNSTLKVVNSAPNKFTFSDGGRNWFIGEVMMGASSCLNNSNTEIF